jgi:hypothetical protein
MENVVGTAVSLKMTPGKPTKKWSLVALVEKNLAKSEGPKASLVPPEIEGAPAIEASNIVCRLLDTQT